MKAGTRPTPGTVCGTPDAYAAAAQDHALHSTDRLLLRSRRCGGADVKAPVRGTLTAAALVFVAAVAYLFFGLEGSFDESLVRAEGQRISTPSESAAPKSQDLPRITAPTSTLFIEFLATSIGKGVVAGVEVVSIHSELASKRWVTKGGEVLGVTGEDGVVRIAKDTIDAEGRVFLARVEWSDFVVPFRQVSPARWTAELPAVAEVRFRVVDASRNPIPDVAIGASRGPIPSNWRQNEETLAVHGNDGLEGLATRDTDSDGMAVLMLEPGVYGVELEHELYAASQDLAMRTFAVPGGPYEFVLAPVLGLAIDVPDEGVHALSVRCKGLKSPNFRGLRPALAMMKSRFPHRKDSVFLVATADEATLKATLTAFLDGSGWVEREYELKRLSEGGWSHTLVMPSATEGSEACGAIRLEVLNANGAELSGVSFTVRGTNEKRTWNISKLHSGLDVMVPPGRYDITWGEGWRLEKVLVESGGRQLARVQTPWEARLCDIELAGRLLPEVVGGVFLEVKSGDEQVARRGLDGAVSGIRMLLPCGQLEFRASNPSIGTLSHFVDVRSDGGSQSPFKIVLGR